MHTIEEYIYWLQNIYVSKKTNEHLNSVKHYVRGLQRIKEVFNLKGNGVFEENSDLEVIATRLINSEYSRTSLPTYLAAYIKFRKHLEAREIFIGSLLRHPDIFIKQQVEIIAIETVTKHYREREYEVVSTERDNIGWDLQASKNHTTLLLEVKGLSGKVTSIELTPNEYENAKLKRNQYKLCIVTSALTNPTLEIFSFDPDLRSWKNEKGETLHIKERVAARFWKDSGNFTFS